MLSKKNQSRIIVISGPSGTGKSTIIKQLLERNPQKLEFSVSTTTRQKRPHEIDGKDYFFVDGGRFMQLLNQGEFIEDAYVHGNHYGTAKQNIMNILNKDSNMCCLLDIDVQGLMSVIKIYPYIQRIFILPPSIEELTRRLLERGDTSPEDAKIRLANATKELSYIVHYNYFIVNKIAEQAVEEIEYIIYG